ncbi:2-dehydropantoate 2-reductase [Alternaria sp. MG1]|nr:2-dehydropantoate 2-reductase [Alternaria sp. MG1]
MGKAMEGAIEKTINRSNPLSHNLTSFFWSLTSCAILTIAYRLCRRGISNPLSLAILNGLPRITSISIFLPASQSIAMLGLLPLVFFWVDRMIWSGVANSLGMGSPRILRAVSRISNMTPLRWRCNSGSSDMTLFGRHWVRTEVGFIEALMAILCQRTSCSLAWE